MTLAYYSLVTYYSQNKNLVNSKQLLTLLTSYFHSYFLFYTTAILNFFQLPPKITLSCSVGFCTCSILCLEYLPTSCLTLLERATPYVSGLISVATSRRLVCCWWGPNNRYVEYILYYRSVKQSCFTLVVCKLY